MFDAVHEDEECTYCRGDPRFEEHFTHGKLALHQNEIRFEGDTDTIIWPKGSVRSVAYTTVFPVDVDAITKKYGIDAAQDVVLGFAERAPEPA